MDNKLRLAQGNFKKSNQGRFVVGSLKSGEAPIKGVSSTSFAQMSSPGGDNDF